MSNESCADFRTCRTCRERKPKTDEFWYRDRGEIRRGKCRECYKAHSRERQAVRRKRLGEKPARRIVGHTYPAGITVLTRLSRVRGTYRYECRCWCGKVFECVNPNKRKSCGCLKNRDDADLRVIYSSYRSRAARKGLDFSITLEEFAAISGQNCTYCNSPPRTRKYTKWLVTLNGVDRVDNSKGYTSGNVVPCCTTCNLAKLDMTAAEFAAWIDMVAKHRPNWILRF